MPPAGHVKECRSDALASLSYLFISIFLFLFIYFVCLYWLGLCRFLSFFEFNYIFFFFFSIGICFQARVTLDIKYIKPHLVLYRRRAAKKGVVGGFSYLGPAVSTDFVPY